jgi:hypothetical protein
VRSQIRLKAGPVINVVAIAISTRIVNMSPAG